MPTVSKVKQTCDFAWGLFHISYTAGSGPGDNLVSNPILGGEFREILQIGLFIRASSSFKICILE